MSNHLFFVHFRRLSTTNLSARVSYALGLKGPCFTLNTACSSTGTALDVAFQYIKHGLCDAAIVAGANLLLHPHPSLDYAQ